MSDNETLPFKTYYGLPLAQLLADRLSAQQPSFAASAFLASVAPHIEALELKGRVSLIARALRDHLPPDYEQALAHLLAILGPELPPEGGMFNDGYWVLPIAQFVEDYGLEAFEPSMAAIYEITKRFSSEFAIRPYIARQPEAVLERLHVWASDPNPHVRRLVSEGSRPRLPWAKRLDLFIADPTPTLALLDRLKDDPALYVRKSVANHLNDISKDHPDRALAAAADWYPTGSEGTRWVVRHGLRTLIKAGSPAALALLGYGAAEALSGTLRITPSAIQVGDALTLSAEIHNRSAAPVEAVIDYRVHFVRANGSHGPKVFKWTTATLAPGETLTLRKNHSMRRVTTRSYYAGLHQVELQVNGAQLANAYFELGLTE